jgi:choline dehydrogenase-like flavoprotein
MARDVTDWPVSPVDLAPFYREVLRFMPLAAHRDDLEQILPVYGDPLPPMPLSTQAARISARAREHVASLRDAGITVGRSRLAVQSVARADTRGCVRCGLCLTGCPLNLIYSAGSTLNQLRTHPRFTYQPGLVVDRVDADGSSVRVLGVDLGTQSATSLRAERVFIACGAVQTTGIVLRSLGTEVEAVLQDSQYFLLPCLTSERSPGVRDEELHTLAQLCMEVIDPSISPESVHMLVYTHNDVLSSLVRRISRLAGPFARKIQDAIEERAIVIQGYLHSRHSGRIAVHNEQLRGGRQRLVLEGRPNPSSRTLIRRVARKLSGLSESTGILPLSSLLRMGPPGKSYHVGGSLPMRTSPQQLETTLLGEISGLPRVHVVDASVFPTIPATNSTYTAMANACRIGAQADV